MRCPSCKKDGLRPTDNFCGWCGIRVNIICGACHFQTTPDNKFCENCGALFDFGQELTDGNIDRIFEAIRIPEE